MRDEVGLDEAADNDKVMVILPGEARPAIVPAPGERVAIIRADSDDQLIALWLHGRAAHAARLRRRRDRVPVLRGQAAAPGHAERPAGLPGQPRRARHGQPGTQAQLG